MVPDLFIIISSDTVRSTGSKRIREITAGHERLDVIARCFLNTLRAANRLAFYTTFILYLSHPKENKAIFIPISKDLSISSELDALLFLVSCFKSEKDSVQIRQISFGNLIRSISTNTVLFYLHPNGVSINDFPKLISPTDSLIFVIGSQKDLTSNQERVLHKFGSTRLSLGDKKYLASHVITVILYCLQMNLYKDI